MKKSHQGFGLVELMIALVIGLVIVLGAGQLFLTGFQSFRKIEDLSIKQSALIFAADVLLRDIRRADQGSIVPSDAELTLDVEGVESVYTLSDGGQGWSLSKDGEPLVDGFKEDDTAFDVDDMGSGVYKVTLNFLEEDEGVAFYAVNRSEAVD